MSRLIVTRTILLLVLGLHVVPALASCSTATYWYGGRMVMCSTCCFGTYCNTTCH